MPLINSTDTPAVSALMLQARVHRVRRALMQQDSTLTEDQALQRAVEQVASGPTPGYLATTGA